MSNVISQSMITRRIIGKRINGLATITAELETFGNNARKYRVRCNGYNVYLTVFNDGKVHGELHTMGRLVATASTLAGFISLLKNCQRFEFCNGGK